MADLPGYIVVPNEPLAVGTLDDQRAAITEAAPRSKTLRTQRRYPVIPTERLIITTG